MLALKSTLALASYNFHRYCRLVYVCVCVCVLIYLTSIPNVTDQINSKHKEANAQ